MPNLVPVIIEKESRGERSYDSIVDFLKIESSCLIPMLIAQVQV